MSAIEASIDQYLEKVVADVELQDMGLLEEPIANKVLEVKNSIVQFRLGHSPFWRLIANLVPSRKVLYKYILNVEDDVSAYRRLQEVIRDSGSAPIVEEDFTRYFRLQGQDLSILPVPRIYDVDGGPYITSSIIIACVDGLCNASIHRIMVVNGEGRVRVVPRHLYRLLEMKRPLPVAVVIGVHPAILLAASSSPPFGVFELDIAAKLLGGLRVCRTPNYSIPVPCGASVVVEGLLGAEYADEGPFVDILGLVDKVRKQPILKPKAVYVNTMFRPWFHVIIPARVEHMLLMGFPREASIYEVVSKVVPEVRAVRLTIGSGGWLHAVISIKKLSEGDAKNAVLAAFAGHPSLKMAVIVDDDIDVDNPYSVEWAIATRFQADKDLIVVCNARGSTLDPSAREGVTCKLGIDATKPVGAGREYKRVVPWPR